MTQTVTVELDAQSAVEQVRRLLPADEVGGVLLNVVEEDVSLSEYGFWHVPVRLSGDPCNLAEVLETLAEAGAVLQVDRGLDIIIDMAD